MTNKNKRISYASEELVNIDLDYDELQNTYIQEQKLLCKFTANQLYETDMVPMIQTLTDNSFYIKGSNQYGTIFDDCIILDAGESLHFPSDSFNINVEVYNGFESDDYILKGLWRPHITDVTSIDYLHCGKSPSLYSFIGNTSSSTKSKITYAKNIYAPYVKNAEDLFYNCTSLQYVENIDLSACDTNETMFGYCSALQSVNKIKIKPGANCERMFQKCTSLKTLPDIEYHNIDNAHALFADNTSLTNVDYINLNLSTISTYLFSDCTGLISIGVLDLENATNISGLCSDCTNLQTIKAINSPNAKSMSSMFYDCNKLTKIERFDISSYIRGENDSALFYECTSIKHVGFVSTNPDTIRAAVVDLPVHEGAAADQYVVDLSMNSQEVLDALTDLVAADGWTIKTTA